MAHEVGGAQPGAQRLSNVEAVRMTLHEAMLADERVLVMGEDVGVRGNVFLITTGFLEEFGAKRVIDMPLAEASIVGIAVGMAMQGLRPIAEIQFADFIYPAVQSDRRRSGQDALSFQRRLQLPAGHPHAVRRRRPRRAPRIRSRSKRWFYHVPGLKIVAPSTPRDIKGLLTAAIEDPDPVLFLEHKKTYRAVKGEVPEGHFTIPIGKADVKKTGTQATVVSYGYNLHQALEAAAQLEAEGISIEVIDLRSIRPMDKTAILTSVRKTRKLLIIHEDNKFGGIGAEISAMVSEEALFDLDAPIRRLCGPDVPAMGYAKPLEEAFMISTERMVDAMRALVQF